MGLKILVCSSEVVPFAKTGGLADVAGALPRVLVGLGHEVRVAMPNYAAIDPEKAKPETVGQVTVQMGDESVSASVAVSRLIPEVPTYLVDCPRYYQRGTLYGEPDDAERFAFFCRALLEFLRTSDWRPDVIHCNDWQTALIPVYLKSTYANDPVLSPIATLFTVHNLAYQGVFEPGVLYRIGLDRALMSMDRLEFYGQANFMKGGLILSDVLNTVSETYAQEIQTPEYGERLEGVLSQRTQDLFGVVNGLDYDEWNPATDKHLAAGFDVKHVEGKAACKADLQKCSHLPVRPGVPLFGLVSRLAGQKGLDLLAEVLPHLLKMDVQFVLLGSGEQYYQDVMADLAQQYPEKMSAVLGFNNALAHQIYGGVDFFLMPSHYEPCGLGQLISVRYGTIPIVRHTGGLADTVVDFNAETEEGNGFSFVDRSPVALLGAISRGILTMGTQPAWQRLVRNAMECDFSWRRSAEAYVSLYTRAQAQHGSK